MIWRAYFAPTELGLVSDCCSYKHSAPTELKAFAGGPSRVATPLIQRFRAAQKENQNPLLSISRLPFTIYSPLWKLN